MLMGGVSRATFLFIDGDLYKYVNRFALSFLVLMTVGFVCLC